MALLTVAYLNPAFSEFLWGERCVWCDTELDTDFLVAMSLWHQAKDASSAPFHNLDALLKHIVWHCCLLLLSNAADRDPKIAAFAFSVSPAASARPLAIGRGLARPTARHGRWQRSRRLCFCSNACLISFFFLFFNRSLLLCVTLGRLKDTVTRGWQREIVEVNPCAFLLLL